MFDDDQMQVDADNNGDDEMELVQDVQSNDPSNWFRDTEPFTAVRWFAREDVSDIEITKRLTANEIKTMKDLRDDYYCMLDLMNKEERKEFFRAIDKASDRMRVITVEQVLGGKVEYDDECIPKEAFRLFAPKAVSVFPDDKTALKEGVRVKKFNLVLGSSGSGKTLFALRKLPALLFGEADGGGPGKAHFSVHFTMESAMFYFDKHSEDIQRSFHQAVTRTVEERVAARIMKANLLNVKEIDLFLHVVIDEAGKERYRIFFDTSAKINKLVQVIQNTMAPTFSKGVYVTVLGTGLEAITADITSMVQAVKFRMQPWALKNFKALAEKSTDTCNKQELIVQTVKDYPMLEHLVSNGRCAYFVFRSLAALKVLAPNRVAEIVNGLIRSVSDLYVRSNGLSILTDSDERFAVVRSVFRELDRSTENKNEAFFPEFKDLDGVLKPLRSIAIGLLENNVETKEGVLGFVRGKEFSLSVSPALVIVMFHLLNIEGEVTWDWHGFESIAMLSELKQMIVNTKNIPSHLNSLVIRLPSPFPGTNAYISASVPRTNTFTVILNGPRAPYADVIAPFKLVQAKHSTDDSTTINLNLKVELDKMGLTNSVDDKHRLSQAVTDTLYGMWTAKNQDIPEPQVEVSKSTKRTHRHACYPVDTLCGRQIKKKIATVVVTVKGASDKAPVAAQSLIWEGRTSFLAEHPVIAVFVTNCQKFELSVMGRERLIGPDDVNWKGELLNSLDRKLLKDMGVRKNVLLRFLFFANRF